jgi:diacylglycerol kinase (ATP)
MSKAVLIYNPGSGKGKAIRLAKTFQTLWQEKFGDTLVLRPTTSKADIRVAPLEHDDSNITIIMGGDGTISEALEGLAFKENYDKITRKIGLLPAGSGNSFLKDFNIHNFQTAAERLLSAIEKNKTKPIDMGIIRYINPDTNQTQHRVFCNIFGVGVVPHIADLAMKMRKLGSLNYSIATLAHILKHKQYKLEVIVDGISENVEIDFLSICNSKYTGGSMLIAPHIQVNDGKLYLVAPSTKSKLQILKLFPQIFTGKHLEHPHVRHHYIQEIYIKSKDPLLLLVDGELEKGSDIYITVKSNYWNLYI